MKANKTINLSTKTNLLEQDLYEYKLQDVSQPELFREIFPYNEVPKVSYNYLHVPMDMPEHIYKIGRAHVRTPVTRAIYHTADGRFV